MTTDLYHEFTKSQMLAALRTLEECIDRSTDEMWNAEHADGPFWRVVHHTLFYTDLYSGRDERSIGTQEFHQRNGHRFLPEKDGPAEPYTRAELREYLDHCIGKVTNAIMAETDATLAGASGFSWLEFSRAETHIYNARHIQHHAAQLGLRFQLAGEAPLRWVGRAT
jgi:hypothetical protein